MFEFEGSTLLQFIFAGYGNLTPRTVLGKAITIVYALFGIPLMFIYMANIGSILATSFKYLYSKLCRCSHPEDLPKKATLPSNKSETTSFLDDEVLSRQSSNSYDDSLSGSVSNGSRRVTLKTTAMKNIVEMARKKNSVIINSEARVMSEVQKNNNNPPQDKSENVDKPWINRLSSKLSRVSAPAESPKEEDVIKFKLVEDIRLVTIPISSCVLVLLTYFVFGAILFAHWEDWTYLDGAYFCFISLMTIGFGDFVPGKSYIYNFDESIPESEANAKLILGAIYMLLGMGIIAMCVNLMQEKIITEVCIDYTDHSCPIIIIKILNYYFLDPTVSAKSGTDSRI